MNNFYLKVKTIISENILNQELDMTAIFFKDKNIDKYQLKSKHVFITKTL